MLASLLNIFRERIGIKHRIILIRDASFIITDFKLSYKSPYFAFLGTAMLAKARIRPTLACNVKKAEKRRLNEFAKVYTQNRKIKTKDQLKSWPFAIYNRGFIPKTNIQKQEISQSEKRLSKCRIPF